MLRADRQSPVRFPFFAHLSSVFAKCQAHGISAHQRSRCAIFICFGHCVPGSLAILLSDDRGGCLGVFTYHYRQTTILSVILSVRSPRSFLQSNEVSGKKSSRLRRRDLRTITNSFPRANVLFRVHKRQKRTRVCANKMLREIRPRLRRDRPTGFTRSLCSRIACNPFQ